MADTETLLHVTTVGELYSFRDKGAALEERHALFSAQRYGTGPDAVLITYGIQGKGYFKGIKDHFAEIQEGVKCVMGFVFKRHVKIYARALRKLATVEVLFDGHPYGEDGPEMSWVVIWNNRD